MQLNVLYTRPIIAQAIAEIAAKIVADCRANPIAGNLILLGRMPPALYFMADLARVLSAAHNNLSVELDAFLPHEEDPTSYSYDLSSYTPGFYKGCAIIVCDVLLGADKTLAGICAGLAREGATVRTAVLMDEEREGQLKPTYAAFRAARSIPHIGYGLPWAAGRTGAALPYIGTPA